MKLIAKASKLEQPDGRNPVNKLEI